MRKPLVVGNWKMNQKLSDIDLFLNEMKNANFAEEIWIAPQSLHISNLIAKSLPGLKVGAQNCSQENTGALTGELSPQSLKDIGAHFVIIGHSERRSIFKEDHESLFLKTKKALENKLKVIFCIGETLAQRESGNVEKVLSEQIKLGLKDIESQDIIIAYEPVWAIGTGVTATPEQAEATHKFIREYLKENTKLTSEKTFLLYGGSVKPENAKELFSCPNIDGALVGGASLKADTFMGLYGN